MKESTFQSNLKKELEDKGYLVWVISDSFTSGIPDIFIAKNGEVMWIELKVIHAKEGQTIHLSDRKSSSRGFEKIQKLKIYELNQAGVDAFGLVYVPEVDKKIKIPCTMMGESIEYKDLLNLPEMKF